MGKVTAAATARIGAPAELVVEILRDFAGSHRRILPPAFSDFTVVEGGVGAGTRMRYTFTIAGRAVPTESVASEPEPGLLLEHIAGSDMVTSFRVTPAGPEACTVEIDSTWTPAGIAERLLAPRLFKGIYRDELQRLEEVARSLAAERPGG